jgi:hypothetical protein
VLQGIFNPKGVNMKFPGEEVKCPHCGEAYNSIISVSIFKTDQDETLTIGHRHYGDNTPMTHITNIRTPNRNRGISVLMKMECEHGHTWARYTAFHKGMLYCNDYLTQKEINEDFDTTHTELKTFVSIEEK